MVDALKELPDVSFIDGVTKDDIDARLVQWWEEAYERETGTKMTLARADGWRLVLGACSVFMYQLALWLDREGKVDLLKYAYGAFLDHLGARVKTARLPAQAAEAVFRFQLSAVRDVATGIPAGTRVTNGQNLFFATTEYAEIPAGDAFIDLRCACSTAGAVGNGWQPGAFKTLVDLIPYMEKVWNLETTTGGADVEDDEAFAERIYLAPASWSVAGPHDAYVKHTLDYGPSIGSVAVSSPEECEVEVRVLLKDGSLPSEALLAGIQEHLSAKDVRPLTDHVTVLAPTLKEYSVNATYWIGRSNASRTAAIQAEMARAVDAYNAWQTEEIGRDINPSELTRLMMAAGAKRVAIASPAFQVVPASAVARLASVAVSYGGVEDD